VSFESYLLLIYYHLYAVRKEGRKGTHQPKADHESHVPPRIPSAAEIAGSGERALEESDSEARGSFSVPYTRHRSSKSTKRDREPAKAKAEMIFQKKKEKKK
jgi:hypothetical protein